MGTKYTVEGTDPVTLRVMWDGPEGTRCTLVDDGWSLLIAQGDVQIDVIPPKRAREGLCAYAEDRADLAVSDVAWAELGRQARRALAVRRAEVTRRLPACCRRDRA